MAKKSIAKAVKRPATEAKAAPPESGGKRRPLARVGKKRSGGTY